MWHSVDYNAKLIFSNLQIKVDVRDSRGKCFTSSPNPHSNHRTIQKRPTTKWQNRKRTKETLGLYINHQIHWRETKKGEWVNL